MWLQPITPSWLPVTLSALMIMLIQDPCVLISGMHSLGMVNPPWFLSPTLIFSLGRPLRWAETTSPGWTLSTSVDQEEDTLDVGDVLFFYNIILCWSLFKAYVSLETGNENNSQAAWLHCLRKRQLTIVTSKCSKMTQRFGFSFLLWKKMKRGKKPRRLRSALSWSCVGPRLSCLETRFSFIPLEGDITHTLRTRVHQTVGLF